MTRRKVSFFATTKTNRRQSPLQKLASERNWRMAQIMGACGNLQRITKDLGMYATCNQLKDHEKEMLMWNDRHWNRERVKVKP